MKSVILMTCLAVALASCGQEAGETAITPELLDQPSQIESIANRLPPADRDVFVRYIAQRSMRVQTGARSLVMPDGEDPETVPEVLELQRAYEALEVERLQALNAASAKMEAAGGSDSEAYSAGVAEYNAALASFEQRLSSPLN